MQMNCWDKVESVYYFCYWKYKRVIAFMRFRKKDRILIQTLSKDYHEVDTRMLHGMFQLLVDFVEIELAHRHRSSELYEKGGLLYKVYKYTPWWLDWAFAIRRSREAGSRHLYWACSVPEEDIKDQDGEVLEYGCPGQAKAAAEQVKLYMWWKDIYPKRLDPIDKSGLSKFYDDYREKLFLTRQCKLHPQLREMYDTLSDEEEREHRILLDLCSMLEQRYLDEEKEMLKRLVDIKETLWT